MYGGCPIVWASTLQTEFALSTTEAEYLALSTALCNTIPIPIMQMGREIKSHLGLPMQTVPTVWCKAFKDNLGAIELAKVPKMRQHTKHINAKYHHFCKYVAQGIIVVEYIRTHYQLADIFTKNLVVSSRFVS
jgi:hypothetical protein